MAIEAPPDTGSSKEDIIDFLGSDDSKNDKVDLLSDDKEPIKTGKKESVKDDSEEELDLELSDESDDEPDEQEKSDDDLELIIPPRKKEILKKYPTLFKDFPGLEKAYYKEQQYTELLPTIEDAKEVVERVKTFEKFESELLSGNIESVLKSVKDADSRAYDKIVDNYLPNLAKADPAAHLHVVGNVMKTTIVSMAREADRIKNDHLRNAALILNQFIFGSSEFAPATNYSKEISDPRIDQESQRLQNERESFLKERFDSAVTDLSSRVDNTLKSTISEHIDPKGTMSDYVRRNATKDALDLLNDQMGSDNRYQTIKDTLWKRAFDSNFSKQSLDAIRTAHLNKAKTLLRDVINRTRNEALRGQDSKRSNGNERDKRGPLPVGRNTGQSKSGNDSKSIPKGMKTLDFLNSD